MLLVGVWLKQATWLHPEVSIYKRLKSQVLASYNTSKNPKFVKWEVTSPVMGEIGYIKGGTRMLY